MKHLPHILILTLTALLTIAVAPARTTPTAIPTADQAKADYYYLEALRQRAIDHHDAAYTLLLSAHQLNPADPAISRQIADYILRTDDPDTTQIRTALSLLTDYTRQNPDDYYENLRYALLTQEILPPDQTIATWQRLHNNHPDKTPVTYQLAQLLAATGDTLRRDQALRLLDTIAARQGNTTDLTTQKINIHLLYNDTLAALTDLNTFTAANPLNPTNLLFQATVYTALNRPTLALQAYDRAIAHQPASGLPHYARAIHYKQQQDTLAYIRDITAALTADDLDIQQKIQILTTHIRTLAQDTIQLPRIRTLLDTLTHQHPESQELHTLYAQYLITLSDYPAAAAQTETLLLLDPTDPNTWLQLTSLQLQSGQTTQALNTATRALTHHPSNPILHHILGTIYATTDHPDQAATHYHQALTLTPDDDPTTQSSILTSLADLTSQNPQLTDTALTLYDRALTLDPQNTTALNNSAYLLARTGRDLPTALSRIQQALQTDPNEPTWLDTYAWVLFQLKQYTQARETIDLTLTLTPDPPAEILQHAGDIYYMDSQPQQALTYWQRALRLTPNDKLLQRKVKNKTYYPQQ